MVPSTYQSSMTAFHSAVATWVDTSEPGAFATGGEDLLSEQPARAKHENPNPSDALKATGRSYSAFITIP
jgi:hypothetical protein